MNANAIPLEAIGNVMTTSAEVGEGGVEYRVVWRSNLSDTDHVVIVTSDRAEAVETLSDRLANQSADRVGSIWIEQRHVLPWRRIEVG